MRSYSGWPPTKLCQASMVLLYRELHNYFYLSLDNTQCRSRKKAHVSHACQRAGCYSEGMHRNPPLLADASYLCQFESSVCVYENIKTKHLEPWTINPLISHISMVWGKNWLTDHSRLKNLNNNSKPLGHFSKQKLFKLASSVGYGVVTTPTWYSRMSS